MKCPCCKYEQKNSVTGYVKIEKPIKSGKRKGETRVTNEWRVIEQPVGDEEFEKVALVCTKYGSIQDFYLNICPKCGVAFKEITQ